MKLIATHDQLRALIKALDNMRNATEKTQPPCTYQTYSCGEISVLVGEVLLNEVEFELEGTES